MVQVIPWLQAGERGEVRKITLTANSLESIMLTWTLVLYTSALFVPSVWFPSFLFCSWHPYIQSCISCFGILSRQEVCISESTNLMFAKAYVCHGSWPVQLLTLSHAFVIFLYIFAFVLFSCLLSPAPAFSWFYSFLSVDFHLSPALSASPLLSFIISLLFYIFKEISQNLLKRKMTNYEFSSR